MNAEQAREQCFFCGKPCPSKRCSRCKCAWYCSEQCQRRHFFDTVGDTNHKMQCREYVKSGGATAVHPADYHSYVASLPLEMGEAGFDEFHYRWSAMRASPDLVALSERVGYPLSHKFFRTHEFLQAIVAHGEDTEENMRSMFGFEMSQEERDRNDQTSGLLHVGGDQTDWSALPCSSPATCRRPCQGLCRRVPKDPFETVGRKWFEARIAVACGVGATEGTFAFDQGARAPPTLPEGIPATQGVLRSLEKLRFPCADIRAKYRRLPSANSEDGSTGLTCMVCQEDVLQSEEMQLLPTCDHIFHPDCIVSWLKRNASCPTCRAILPETVPLPATFQERNMAVRLSQHQEDTTSGISRRPLPASVIANGTYSGAYDHTVQLVFRVSDELDFSGGAASIAVSPSGREIAVTSTSIGKISLVSTETSTLIGSARVGRSFPGGPKDVVYDASDSSEKTLIAVVDKQVVKYRCSPTQNGRKLPLAKEWSTGVSSSDAYLSMDKDGRVLVSMDYAPKFWLGGDGNGKSRVPLPPTGDDGDNENAFNEHCIEGHGEGLDEPPTGGALSLPSGDIVFIHGLASCSAGMSLGLLRKGQSEVDKVPVSGITRSDLGDDCVGGYFWTFACSPCGDIVLLSGSMSGETRLVHITNPAKGGCRASCTILRGFRMVEEIESVSVDSGNCVYILVVCNWPCEREIYLVNPKP